MEPIILDNLSSLAKVIESDLKQHVIAPNKACIFGYSVQTPMQQWGKRKRADYQAPEFFESNAIIVDAGPSLIERGSFVATVVIKDLAELSRDNFSLIQDFQAAVEKRRTQIKALEEFTIKTVNDNKVHVVLSFRQGGESALDDNELQEDGEETLVSFTTKLERQRTHPKIEIKEPTPEPSSEEESSYYSSDEEEKPRTPSASEDEACCSSDGYASDESDGYGY